MYGVQILFCCFELDRFGTESRLQKERPPVRSDHATWFMVDGMTRCSDGQGKTASGFGCLETTKTLERHHVGGIGPIGPQRRQQRTGCIRILHSRSPSGLDREDPARVSTGGETPVQESTHAACAILLPKLHQFNLYG